jgi:hypothetical protein
MRPPGPVSLQGASPMGRDGTQILTYDIGVRYNLLVVLPSWYLYLNAMVRFH